jgi:hypothetical protein
VIKQLSQVSLTTAMKISLSTESGEEAGRINTLAIKGKNRWLLHSPKE